ncbi:MAG: aldo/keto reductase [Gemmatimonadales bacterium]|nr:aldo/keto reductase [Gemmatimonadales bacterium]
MLGEFVASERHRYVVTTKYTNTLHSGFDPSIRDHPNAGGNHKKSMVQSVEGSLKRLGVDYIDLLWIHFWDYSTDIADVMRNVNDLVRHGKVLHFGLCNTPAWVVARGQTVADQRGWEPISALQYQYNLVSRDLELEIIPCSRALGISVNALLAAGRRLPDRQVHARRQHGEPTLRQRVLQTTDLPVRREGVRHRPQGGRDRRPSRNQFGRGGPGVGARPRRDPDDRGPEGLPDRGQPALPVTHPARRGHAGAERGERPRSALDVPSPPWRRQPDTPTRRRRHVGCDRQRALPRLTRCLMDGPGGRNYIDTYSLQTTAPEATGRAAGGRLR